MFGCKLHDSKTIKRLFIKDFLKLISFVLIFYGITTFVVGGFAWIGFVTDEEIGMVLTFFQYSWFVWIIGFFLAWIKSNICKRG